MSPENTIGIMPPFASKIFESSVAQKTYKKGAYIYHTGEEAQGIYQVIKGRIKLWKSNKRGTRSLTFKIIHPFELFGLIDFFDKAQTRRCAATAIDNEVILQYIPFTELEQSIFKDDETTFSIIQSLIKHYESSWEKLNEFKVKNMNLKVFKVLQKLANEEGIITETGIELKGITHQELADFLGISRQSVSIAMNNCRKEGKIEYDRSRVLIKNQDHSKPLKIEL